VLDRRRGIPPLLKTRLKVGGMSTSPSGTLPPFGCFVVGVCLSTMLFVDPPWMDLGSVDFVRFVDIARNRWRITARTISVDACFRRFSFDRRVVLPSHNWAAQILHRGRTRQFLTNLPKIHDTWIHNARIQDESTCCGSRENPQRVDPGEKYGARIQDTSTKIRCVGCGFREDARKMWVGHRTVAKPRKEQIQGRSKEEPQRSNGEAHSQLANSPYRRFDDRRQDRSGISPLISVI
jgi:hypothetical protein